MEFWWKMCRSQVWFCCSLQDWRQLPFYPLPDFKTRRASAEKGRKQTQVLHPWLPTLLNCQLPPQPCCCPPKPAFSSEWTFNGEHEPSFVTSDLALWTAIDLCPSFIYLYGHSNRGLNLRVETRSTPYLRTLHMPATPKHDLYSFVKLNVLQFTFCRTGKNPRDSVQIYNESGFIPFHGFANKKPNWQNIGKINVQPGFLRQSLVYL